MLNGMVRNVEGEARGWSSDWTLQFERNNYRKNTCTVLYMFRGQIGDIKVNVNDIKKSLRPESIIKRLERGQHDNTLVELHRSRSLAR